jgi:hypothetical protein
MTSGGGVSDKHEQCQVWLKGWPRAACGVRVRYSNGDDEWWSGDPKEAGCRECWRVVGYTLDRPYKAIKVYGRGLPLSKLSHGKTRDVKKLCNKCGLRPRVGGGHHTYCRPCINADQRKRWHEKRAREKAALENAGVTIHKWYPKGE